MRKIKMRDAREEEFLSFESRPDELEASLGDILLSLSDDLKTDASAHQIMQAKYKLLALRNTLKFAFRFLQAYMGGQFSDSLVVSDKDARAAWEAIKGVAPDEDMQMPEDLLKVSMGYLHELVRKPELMSCGIEGISENREVKYQRVEQYGYRMADLNHLTVDTMIETCDSLVDANKRLLGWSDAFKLVKDPTLFADAVFVPKSEGTRTPSKFTVNQSMLALKKIAQKSSGANYKTLASVVEKAAHAIEEGWYGAQAVKNAIDSAVEKARNARASLLRRSVKAPSQLETVSAALKSAQEFCNRTYIPLWDTLKDGSRVALANILECLRIQQAGAATYLAYVDAMDKLDPMKGSLDSLRERGPYEI